MAGMGVVVGASFFARVATPVGGSTRLIWSLVQIVIGLVFFGVGQFSAYMFAVSGSDKFGPFDIAMKPIEIWKTAFTRLPSHAWRVWLAGWGLTAIMGALLLVGGIRFSAIFDDWGFEQPAQQNLVQAIVSEAKRQKEDGAESLEEAMNEFAGEGEEAAAAAEEAKLVATDCLIVGYTPEGKDDFSMILLGAFVENKLQFVGTLTVEELSEEAHVRLRERMPNFTQEKPFLKTGYAANWLQPKLMCRVKSDGFTRSNKLKDAVFDSLLVDVKAGQ